MNAFDLTIPAPNGLRRGMTTGTCATAAVKAALARLLYNESCAEVPVTLADGQHFVLVPIQQIHVESDGGVRAEVTKDAGDDPDQTHRAIVFATVRRNDVGCLRFLRGPGVGLVTQPGLQIPAGEPAINPVPRQMMRQAVREVLSESGDYLEENFDLEIGCINGEEIAKRTFNPRLGIEGGISILGTTGIVEPKSLAAFKASIEIYIRVAVGDQPPEIVLAPGNLGQRFARTNLQLTIKRVVQMSNFVGFALDCVERTLAGNDHRLPRLWMVGHPGKLAKLLDNVWDTHSEKSTNAVAAVSRLAREHGFSPTLCNQLERSTTVEGIVDLLESEQTACVFWRLVETRIEAHVSQRLSRVETVAVRLFSMGGQALGGTS